MNRRPAGRSNDPDWRSSDPPVVNGGAELDARRQNRQEKRFFTDPPDNALMAQMFHEIARIYQATSSFPTIPERSKNLIIPFANDDTRVKFVNHYGDTFFNILRFEPKVITFEKAKDNQTDTLNKIKSAIANIIDKLHAVATDRFCCTEIDFLKLVFMNPKPPNHPPDSELSSIRMSTLFEEKSDQLPNSYNRMCLEDQEETLLDVLRESGVTILEKNEVEDDIRVEVYRYGFEFDDHVFQGSFDVRPDDLSFSNWKVYRQLNASYFLPNPGNECNSEFQIEGSDIRMYCLDQVKVKIKELKEMAEKLGTSLPSCLTSPNLGGLLERNIEGEFRTNLNSGIAGIFSTTNRIKYEMSINGIPFHLLVGDLRYLKKQRRSFVIERCGIRWPKFRIPVPPKDEHDIANHVDTFSDLIMKLLHSLSSGRLSPKNCQINFIHRGVPTPSLMIQNRRRRIVENESLAAMLDLPPEASRNDTEARLVRLIDDIDNGLVPLPASTVDKLKQAAKLENF